MKHIIYILSILLLCLAPNSYLSAQKRAPKFDIEEVRAQKWTVLSTQAKLTEPEKAKALPIFNEYEAAVWKLNNGNREMFREMRDKEKNAVDYEKLNNQYILTEVKEAELLQKYHEQLSKIFSPQTLYEYYRAERHYKQKLLQDLRKPRDSK